MGANNQAASRSRWAPISQTRLAAVMHLGMVVLLAASAVRYFTRHGWGDNAPAVVAWSVFVLVVYIGGVVLRLGGTPAVVWIATVIAGWSALALTAPSFAWCAFPLFFVCLRDLSGRVGFAALGAITAVSVVAQLRVASPPDASLVVGPVTVALLTAATYRVLLNETKARQQLIDDLMETRNELAEQQRSAGLRPNGSAWPARSTTRSRKGSPHR